MVKTSAYINNASKEHAEDRYAHFNNEYKMN